MNFKDYEQPELRKVRRLKIIGKILTRVYRVPKDAAAGFESTTLPRGTIMPGEANALISPRIKNIQYGQPDNEGFIFITIDWIQPEVYA